MVGLGTGLVRKSCDTVFLTAWKFKRVKMAVWGWRTFLWCFFFTLTIFLQIFFEEPVVRSADPCPCWTGSGRCRQRLAGEAAASEKIFFCKNFIWWEKMVKWGRERSYIDLRAGRRFSTDPRWAQISLSMWIEHVSMWACGHVNDDFLRIPDTVIPYIWYRIPARYYLVLDTRLECEIVNTCGSTSRMGRARGVRVCW